MQISIISDLSGWVACHRCRLFSAPLDSYFLVTGYAVRHLMYKLNFNPSHYKLWRNLCTVISHTLGLLVSSFRWCSSCYSQLRLRTRASERHTGH